MLATPIGRVRGVGILEGLSYLLLLGVAMPLKYMAGIPEAVMVVGWAHGALFVAYVLVAGYAAHVSEWSILRFLMVFGAALIPFGPFLIDGTLKREDASIADTT